MSRSKTILRETFLNYIYKIINLGFSFIMVPLTLNYLGKEIYGVWSIILSFITWANLSDFGIGNGLRNRLASNISINKENEAFEYNSTAHYIVSLISIALFIILTILNSQVKIIKTDLANVTTAIFIIIFSFSIHLVLGLARYVSYAKQKSSYVGFVQLVEALSLLLIILFLNNYTKSSIVYMAFAYGLTLIFGDLILNFLVYHNDKWLIPRKYGVNKKRIKSITSLGIAFFIIQVSYVILMSTDNYIIGTFIGYSDVTDYSVIFKIYSTLKSIFSIALISIWSGVTAAYANKEFELLRKIEYKLLLLTIPYAIVVFIITFFIDLIISIWLGDSINISKDLVYVSMIYNVVYAYIGIYTNMLNGLGKIKIQMILYVIAAIVNIPLSIFLAVNMNMGSTGVKLATLICVIPLVLVMPIQYKLEIKKMYLKEPLN